MAISDKIRWKRLVNEMRFLHNELSFVDEVVKESGIDFHQHYLRLAAQHGLNIPALNREHSERLDKLYNRDPQKISPVQFSDFSGSACGALILHSGIVNPEQEIIQDDEEVYESFHKLFKRLALKLHPDKIHGETSIEQGLENIRLFKEAGTALEKRKYFILLDIAERLHITRPRNYKQQIRWMKRQTTILDTKTQNAKNTYNYMFSECATDEERDTLTKRFIAHLFNIHL